MSAVNMKALIEAVESGILIVGISWDGRNFGKAGW